VIGHVLDLDHFFFTIKIKNWKSRFSAGIFAMEMHIKKARKFLMASQKLEEQDNSYIMHEVIH